MRRLKSKKTSHLKSPTHRNKKKKKKEMNRIKKAYVNYGIFKTKNLSIIGVPKEDREKGAENLSKK